jgi:phosphoribosylaminoimidazolecarboxamide formyltransferase / IMP cyclohydrolase
VARILLSVTDKSGLVDFARVLHSLGHELVSTGGTAKALAAAGLPVTEVSEVTQFPEMLDGRVKTLHPMIHGGLLGDTRLESHRTALKGAGIEPIALAVVNLYAFEQTVSKPHSREEAIESIDIGGPAMIRSAAKNHGVAGVVVDPADYEWVAGEMKDGGLSEASRLRLAAKAFRHTALYDSMISRYLTAAADSAAESTTAETLTPESLTLGLKLSQTLRHGENPHQKAALYLDPMEQGGAARARQLHGKELSYNNFLDGDAAWELACDLEPGSVVIVKHGNPCGAAQMGDLSSSYTGARDADPISAFGGIAACNGRVDREAAMTMTAKGNFLEVVIAAGFDEEALEIFAKKTGWGVNVRLLEAVPAPAKAFLYGRSIRGGMLIQDSDEDPGAAWVTAGKIQPTEAQMRALKLGWKVIPHVKSNGILVASAERLLGTGAGQMNRVQSVRLALQQAGDLAQGAILASDAFFPFPDSIEEAAKSGIGAVIQPGGSKKDGEVIEAADRLGIAMVLTGTRRFRH